MIRERQQRPFKLGDSSNKARPYYFIFIFYVGVFMAKKEKRKPVIEMLAGVMDARQSIANGNEAMDRVESNAEASCPGWLEAAEYCIMLYPEEVFLIEDVREWAYKVGLQEPHKHQAWSGPTKRMRAAGVIWRDGFGRRKYKKHHGNLIPQWRKRLTGAEFHGETLDLPPHGLPIVDKYDY